MLMEELYLVYLFHVSGRRQRRKGGQAALAEEKYNAVSEDRYLPRFTFHGVC